MSKTLRTRPALEIGKHALLVDTPQRLDTLICELLPSRGRERLRQSEDALGLKAQFRDVDQPDVHPQNNALPLGR